MSSYRNIFNLWLSYVAGMVCFGWLLSAMDAYRWMGAAALLLACTLAFLFHRSWRGIQPEEKECLKNDLRFPPFLLLLFLIALAGSLYTTAVLDSLSYRIPRMLMWLQEGRVHYIDNPDGRLNFMTPIWEFASTPLYQAAGFRLLWLGSGISWILLYLAFVFLSRKLGADPKTSRWLAIIPSASVGFVLQAASTMNDVWAAALLAVSLAFILMFEEKREFRDLVSSGLALALAAGAKPHFAVLALPWLIWCFLSRSKPLSSVRWRWALPVAALALLCSPLPTFITNHLHYGSFKGPAGDGGFALGSWWLNILLGSVMMGWQMFQPPLNPWAGSLERMTDSWAKDSGLLDLAPRFGLGARELSIVDSASLGLIAAVILSFGALIAIRNRKCCPAWARYAAIAAVLGFIAAVSQVVPGTLGRSFLGFIVIAMPLCMAGLLRMNPKALIFGATLCLLVSMVAIVVSPSHPLLPVRSAAAKNVALSTYLKPYFAFQERTVAGVSLVRKIPDGPHEVGILANSDQNLVHLWGDRATRNTVKFHPKSATPDTLHSSTSDYLILAGSVEGVYLDLREKLIADVRFEVLAEDTYQTKNERGPETWTLIRPIQ
jgi:hypothetical protein